jgi:serine/threonine protein kinase
MAPEVAQKKSYTKSVDIWAIGIIMHLVLTGGKNPVYNKGIDTFESLKTRLCSIKKVEADPSFSKIAEHLFNRLTAV